MSKIICDICGTAYSENMENCPVCGCSRDFGLDDFSEELLMGESGAGSANRKKKPREIFDYDEVNQPEMMDPDLDEDFDEEYLEEEPRSNTALVVILLVLIVLLLVAAGFFFLRYFLPNMKEQVEETVSTVETVPTEAIEEIPVETGIACTDIVIPGGKVELAVGGKWLMNVQVYPQDTTDVLSYSSADENIVTVTEDGTVTAVAEGQTTITINCGKVFLYCNVLVDNAATTEATEAGTIPPLAVEETVASGETTADAEPEEEASATEEAAADTEQTEQVTIPEGEILKLKKTDITIFSRYTSVTLELDCVIPAENVYWFTMDSTVAIVNNGVVTATGSGITRIYGEYEGQQVECIVRCNFA